MKFGLYLFAGNPPQFHIPDAERYRAAIEQAQMAESLGFDFVWAAEHHFDCLTTPNPFILCAAIAARTTRLRIGTSISIAPLHHPAMLAEDAAMLDVISNGRFDLGVGVGYEQVEFDTFGVSLRERGSRTEEALTVLKGLWTEPSYTFNGRHFTLEDITLHPKPVQQPHPPIWVAVDRRTVDGTLPPALARAARHGCHLSGQTDPEMLRLYDQALADSGHDPASRWRSCVQAGFVGASKQAAWADYAPHVLIQRQNYLDAYAGTAIHQGDDSSSRGDGAQALSADRLPELAESGAVDFLGKPFVVGTPDDVAAVIESLRVRGITHYIFWMHIGGIEPRKTEQAMRLFAEEVMPRFRQSPT